jgi:hypothetical protein
VAHGEGVGGEASEGPGGADGGGDGEAGGDAAAGEAGGDFGEEELFTAEEVGGAGHVEEEAVGGSVERGGVGGIARIGVEGDGGGKADHPAGEAVEGVEGFRGIEGGDVHVGAAGGAGVGEAHAGEDAQGAGDGAAAGDGLHPPHPPTPRRTDQEERADGGVGRAGFARGLMRSGREAFVQLNVPVREIDRERLFHGTPDRSRKRSSAGAWPRLRAGSG